MLRDVLVTAALPARDRSVAPFDRGSHHAAALSWADGNAAWANADGGVIAPTIPIVAVGAVVAVPPDLNIDALGHLEVLGLAGVAGGASAPAGPSLSSPPPASQPGGFGFFIF